MTKLTLQDFVHSLIGTKNNSKRNFKRALSTWLIAREEIEELHIKWDGRQLLIYPMLPDVCHPFESFGLQKYKGYYYLDLEAQNGFTFQFKIIGKQLIKNKEYKIIDFYE